MADPTDKADATATLEGTAGKRLLPDPKKQTVEAKTRKIDVGLLNLRP